MALVGKAWQNYFRIADNREPSSAGHGGKVTQSENYNPQHLQMKLSKPRSLRGGYPST